MGRVAHRRCRAHPAARTAGPDGRGPGRGALGALRRRLPGVDRHVDPAATGPSGDRRRRRLHQRGGGRPARSSAASIPEGSVDEFPVRPFRPQQRLDRPRRGQQPRREWRGAPRRARAVGVARRACTQGPAHPAERPRPARARSYRPAGRSSRCAVPGNRSARAAGILAADGRTVVNLSGGMRAWAAAGLPVVARGGRPGSIT